MDLPVLLGSVLSSNLPVNVQEECLVELGVDKICSTLRLGPHFRLSLTPGPPVFLWTPDSQALWLLTLLLSLRVMAYLSPPSTTPV